MSNIMKMGTLFDGSLVTDLFNKVKGHSSLAKLSGQDPIGFTGTDLFTFNFDKDIDIVGESGEKGVGGITLEPVNIVPIKVEYGARVSDEFLYATEEKRLQIMAAYNEGFARKLARGIDIMAMHGYNPRTGSASALIGTNHFDAITNSVTIVPGQEDEAVEDAVALIGDYEMSGIAMSRAFAGALAKLKNGSVKMFPELAWGANPEAINGVPSDVNTTVSVVQTDAAYIGDFASAFKWGIAKQIPLTVIPYGDPDNTGRDLAGHNEVYLRCEAYVGWGILDQDAFTRIEN